RGVVAKSKDIWDERRRHSGHLCRRRLYRVARTLRHPSARHREVAERRLPATACRRRGNASPLSSRRHRKHARKDLPRSFGNDLMEIPGQLNQEERRLIASAITQAETK